MSKIKIVVSCPIDTYSGYGARARDVVKALVSTNKYDVKVISQRWGNTPFSYLKDHKEDELLSLIIPEIKAQPDVWIQITVPNEFQKVGKYNIGITAGIETTLCAKEWIDGLNRMDLVLTSSEHSKTVLNQTKWDVRDKNNNIVQSIKAEVPMEVLFEGIDTKKYFAKPSNDFDLSEIKESFCFLFVGHWLQGNVNEDRKNVGYLIKSFLEMFKNKQKQPALILKTSAVGSSILDRERMLDKIDDIRKTVKGKLPNIYLIHGDVTDSQINDLYNNPKVKCMVSWTRGEGFGRPLLEFSLVKKPILTTGWSGHIDFLNPEQSLLVGGQLTKVHPSAVQKGVILPESQWFKPDDGQVGNAYKQIFKQYKKWLPKAKQLGYKNSKEFTLEKMAEKLDMLLESNLPEFPKQVELELPKLDLPKLTT
tara:strand:- start:3006 stop:4271 length:1266 start_codon:yes stop_codon:yes gene_type:complete